MRTFIGILLLLSASWSIAQVTNLNDAGPGSLRAAIAAATDGDTITFDASLAGQTITLTSGQLNVTVNNLTIDASGLPNQVTVERDNAAGRFRIFNYTGSGTFSVNNLTIQNGDVGGSGGGISSSNGTVTVINSTVTGNTADDFGGGISSNGTVTVINSTVTGNTADNLGGGIGSGGNVTLINSTVSENDVNIQSGGINANGSVTVTNSRVTGNSAGIVGGGIVGISNVILTNSTVAGNNAGNNGGGIASDGTVTLNNSLVLGNNASINPQIRAPGVTLNNSAYGFAAGQSTGNTFVGLTVADVFVSPEPATSAPTTAGNYRLVLGSPAIDAGNDTLAAGIPNDLEGNARVQAVAVDMGAYESFISTQTITFAALANRTYGDPTFTVNATASSGLDVTFSSATPAICTTSGTNGEDITLVATGTCTINANQAGNVNFNPAPQAQQSFTVAPKALTATVDDQSRIFGAANPTFTITYAGFVGADTATDLDSLATATTTADVTTPVGTVPITCDVTGFSDTNYTLAAGDCTNGTLTIGTVALTITAEDVTFVSGDPVPTYTVTYNGFVGADDPSVLGGTLDITDDTGGDYTTLGVFTLTPSGLTSTNYAITFVPGTLTIVRNPITQAPDIQIRNGNSTSADSITSNGLVPLSYGIFKRNQTVILDYRVRNPGAKTLDIGELTLPSFFSLEGDALPESLASFESALLQVHVDTSIAGTLTGQVSLASNDPDNNENPFTFDVVITISNEPANAVYVLPGVDLADVTVSLNQQNVPVYSAKLQVPTGSVAVTLNSLSLTSDNLPALSNVQSLTLVIDGGTRGIRDSRDVVLATLTTTSNSNTDSITFRFPERTLQPNLPLWLLVVADF